MMLEGRVWKDGKFWLAEIPALDYLTQGKTRKEALEMAQDIVLTGIEQPGFAVTLSKDENDTFFIASNNPGALVAHMLKRQRQKYGLTVRELSARMHSASPNAFSAYERGKVTPTVNKLEELFHAINPKGGLVLKVA